MQNIIQSTSEMPSDTLFLHVYYAEEGSSYIFYEDDGTTYDYENGESGTRKIEFDPQGKKIIIGETEGRFGSRLSKICLVLHGFDFLGDEIKVNGEGIKTEAKTIDLITALADADALYLGGKKYTQEVKQCVFSLAKAKPTQLTW